MLGSNALGTESALDIQAPYREVLDGDLLGSFDSIYACGSPDGPQARPPHMQDVATERVKEYKP